MDGGGKHCSVEDCESNQGGYCNAPQAATFGFATAGLFMPGTGGFFTPFSTAVGMLNTTQATGQLPGADGWGTWRNCPKRRERDLRK